MAIPASSTTERTVTLSPSGQVALRQNVRRSAWRWPAIVSPQLIIGSALLALLIIAAIFAPILAISPPDEIEPVQRLLPPSPEHPFGTDQLGRDLFSRVIYGSRLALQMSVLSVALSAIPGIVLGLIAGYYRNWINIALTMVMDAWLSFPGLLLAIVLVARMGPSLGTTVIALGIVGVPAFYRLVRNSTMSARHALYIEAAYSMGFSEARILFRHVLPNLASPIIVLTTLRLGAMLLAGGGLSFIGLGAQPPDPEWGALLAAGRDSMGRAWWLATFPGLAIALSVLGFNLMGDGLRDALAPDQKSRRSHKPKVRRIERWLAVARGLRAGGKQSDQQAASSMNQG